MDWKVTDLILPKECFPRLAYAARNVPKLKERCFKILKDFGEDTSIIDQSRNLESVYVKLFNKNFKEEQLSVDEVVFRNKEHTESSTTLNQKETLETALKEYYTSKRSCDISVVITSSKLKDEVDKLENGFGHYFIHVASGAEEARAFTKECRIQNKRVKVLYTTREQLPRDLNNLLEKIAYKPLKPAYERLENISKEQGQRQLNKMDKEQIECLCEEILALYEVSNVPEEERPCVTKETGFSITKEICKDIFTQCPTVVALSFHFNKLHVYVRDNIGIADISEKEMINKLMEKHKVKEFCITLQDQLIELMEIGSTIEAEPLEKKGSLGCYADMVGDQTSVTCLLLSKHVAQGCSDIYIVENVKEKIATVIQETTIDEDGSLDIAAAVLEDDVKLGINERKLKDSNGDRLEGSFPERSKKYLQRGRQVHIWGSKSKPGIGVIIDESYFIKGMKASLILIHDYSNGKIGRQFAHQGDSGSIICTDDPNDECVYALAMLIGCLQNKMDDNPNVKRQYIALLLEDGVKQLERLTERKFKVFP